jgi:putative ABC transport system substrate-binding protein
MNRRGFIHTAPFVLMAFGPGVHAQRGNRLYRVGILGNASASELSGAHPTSPVVAAFLGRMRQLGYAYGENFVTETRGSEGEPERFQALAAELAHLQLDVIVAVGPALPALKRITTTIPIVMAAASDPVALGYVQSLGRPGGNFTGLSLQALETTGKRLELLRVLVPGNQPIAVVWDRPGVAYWHAAESAARSHGWKVISLEIRQSSDVEAVFTLAREKGAGALLVHAAAFIFPRRREFAELAITRRLPAMYELRPYAEAGGLMSYGVDIDNVWSDAAVFVDKILRGARPQDLPVEQPTKFELLVNQKSANAMGLRLPKSLLIRADEVIE